MGARLLPAAASRQHGAEAAYCPAMAAAMVAAVMRTCARDQLIIDHAPVSRLPWLCTKSCDGKPKQKPGKHSKERTPSTALQAQVVHVMARSTSIVRGHSSPHHNLSSNTQATLDQSRRLTQEAALIWRQPPGNTERPLHRHRWRRPMRRTVAGRSGSRWGPTA